MQDTFLRVFGLLGKIDSDLQNPRAYLIRTATNLWIDRERRHALDSNFRRQAAAQSEVGEDDAARSKELDEAFA